MICAKYTSFIVTLPVELGELNGDIHDMIWSGLESMNRQGLYLDASAHTSTQLCRFALDQDGHELLRGTVELHHQPTGAVVEMCRRSGPSMLMADLFRDTYRHMSAVIGDKACTTQLYYERQPLSAPATAATTRAGAAPTTTSATTALAPLALRSPSPTGMSEVVLDLRSTQTLVQMVKSPMFEAQMQGWLALGDLSRTPVNAESIMRCLTREDVTKALRSPTLETVLYALRMLSGMGQGASRMLTPRGMHRGSDALLQSLLAGRFPDPIDQALLKQRCSAVFA